jgi:hypothetical protein
MPASYVQSIDSLGAGFFTPVSLEHRTFQGLTGNAQLARLVEHCVIRGRRKGDQHGTEPVLDLCRLYGGVWISG